MVDKKLNIYEKLCAIQEMWLTFEKTADNPFFKSKYITLDGINIKLKPILSTFGIVVVHKVVLQEVATRAINSESPEEVIESIIPFPEGLTDPQKIWWFITYAKRYNTVAIFNLDTEQDDDGNTASWKKKVEKKPSTDKKKITKKNVEAFLQKQKESPSIKDKIHLANYIRKFYTISEESLEELHQMMMMWSLYVSEA